MSNSQLTILDLFSGIGGFSYGLEKTGGFRTVAFCEQNAYATRVLNKHWPLVPVFSDVRHIGPGQLVAECIDRPDVICGGFPCQDISLAGKGAGLDGERSGLWFEYLRIITETRPSWVIIENVSALRSRGLEVVLGGLAAIGYDAEWHCITAASVGAPHRRDRVWIIAYPRHCGQRIILQHVSGAGGVSPYPRGNGEIQPVAHPVRLGSQGGESIITAELRRRLALAREARRDVADTDCEPWDEWWEGYAAESPGGRDADRSGVVADVADASSAGLPITEPAALLGAGRRDEGRAASKRGWWAVEPDVGRVAHGIPARVDRLRCLGNSIVPQIAEIIGHAILCAHSVA